MPSWVRLVADAANTADSPVLDYCRTDVAEARTQKEPGKSPEGTQIYPNQCAFFGKELHKDRPKQRKTWHKPQVIMSYACTRHCMYCSIPTVTETTTLHPARIKVWACSHVLGLGVFWHFFWAASEIFNSIRGRPRERYRVELRRAGEPVSECWGME